MERTTPATGVVNAVATRNVVTAKLAIPRLSPIHLHRPRLVSALEHDGAPVTLISAPAGYGKTSVVAEFAASHHDHVGWLSLDERDDESGLWAGVLAALCVGSAVAPDSPLRSLAVPGSPTADPAFVAEVDSALHAVPSPVTLVLDDVHELAPAARVALDHMVRRLPDTVRLVLLTRRDPPLPLARLRLDGRLHDMRADDLAMDASEVADLLVEVGMTLTDTQVDVLLQQTGGWPAGVRLAAQSLVVTGDPDAYLDDLAGNDYAIADYLVTEILSRLPEPAVHLLHSVSICDQLPSSLVTALTDVEDAAEVFDSLERTTGLVTTYGPGRAQYRVHPLLRAHMKANLRRTRPHTVTGLHRRAAGWFLAHGMRADALRHLTASEDVAALLALLHEQGTDLIADGYGSAVLDAIATLPAEVTAADPLLLAVESYARLGRGELAAAQHALDQADAAHTTTTTASTGPEAAATLAIARTRLSLARDRLFHPPGTVPPALGSLGTAWSDRRLEAQAAIAASRVQEAEDLVREVLADPHIDEFARARATSVLALATGLRGGFAEMADLAEQASDLGSTTGRWEDTDAGTLSAILTGYAELMRCRPAATLAGLARADTYATRMGPAVVLTPLLDVLRATARFDLGERETAFDLMHRARTSTVVDRARDEQIALVAMLAHGMAVQLGRRDEAHAVTSWAGTRLAGTAELAIMRATGSAAISRFSAARRLAEPVLDGMLRAELPWSVVEGRLLECTIALGTGNRARAERALTAAVRAARDVGVLRPLTTATTAVTALMRARLGALGALDDLAAEALAVRGRHGLLDPPTLTDRERAVLAQLPSLRPIAEIAADMGVSPNTVKSHVKALYAKFGAGSRREAVDAATRLGLIRGTPSGHIPAQRTQHDD
ncbi:helix-turn-helix transcriptional regulator [Pseudonocardia sulfidoxydans NBRC 16205]|uniref:Helix-turn-helix transcriptional regulator n=1 Tax=Pseudonocardia sulfidoxydans NBRC 16205 TaxID=1223511 RepID=A0A511DHD1_9PSEU|nr:LuxR C-terminal-related transcriptional regulator [Pseudonocardia sulfidoxydans]GEL22398.1 helix-turn-helix transcriptional regulator [Pseudonocardia sulfidoxydans NBRC 16205]